MKAINIQTILQTSGFLLQSRLEAEVLLSQALGVPRSFLHTWPEQELNPQTEAQFNRLLQRRYQGEPIAYIIGHKEFWSLSLKITKEVLIPRPETELLVEQALAVGEERENIRVLDLGTGSGAIALALAKERPQWQITAIDNSSAALEVAMQNAKSLALTNVQFYKSNWFDCFSPGIRFDLIVSNPPYVALQEVNWSQNEIRYEPKEALVAKEDGFRDLKKIIFEAGHYLASKNWLILEHGSTQDAQIREWMTICGWQNPRTLYDLAGLPRISLCQKS